MEAAAETDDALVEQYLESGELTAEQLHDGAAQRRCASAASCRCCAAPASKNIGIAPLLDFVVDYTPSPAERAAGEGEDPKIGEPIEREPSPSAPFSAFVFKTIVDPFSGKLSVFQVVSGELRGDSTVLNVNKDGKERIGHLLRLEGKKQSAGRQADHRRDRRRRQAEGHRRRRHAGRREGADPLPRAGAVLGRDLLRHRAQGEGRRGEGDAGACTS